MPEIIVELIDLPTTIRGFVRQNLDGYTIVINSRLSAETQHKTFIHEKQHIDQGDFESIAPVDQIELDRHEQRR